MKQLRGALAALGVLVAIWAVLAVVGYFMDAFPPPGGEPPPVDAGVPEDAGAAPDASAPAHDAASPRAADAAAVPHPATSPDGGAVALDAHAAPPPAAPAAHGPVLARTRLCDGTSAEVSVSTVALLGDARPELAVVCDGAAMVLVIDVVGSGRDARFTPRRVLTASVPDGRGPRPVVSAVSAADVDGDGRADLAVGLAPSGAGGAGGLVLLPRDASGAFGRARALAPIAVADLLAAPLDDHDGLELVALTARPLLDARPSEVWAFGGQSAARTALLRGPRGGRVLSAADLDGDGHLDVLAASGGDDDAIVWLGDGHAFPRSEALAAHAVRGAVAGDLDRDGEADVVLAGDHAWLVRRAPPPAPDADAQAAHVLELAALDVANGVRHLVAADVDDAPGDELVGYAPPALVVLDHPGAPGAAPLALERHDLRAFHDGEPVPLALAAADLDGDGKAELVFLGRTADGAPVELVIVHDVAGLSAATLADHADALVDAPLTLALSLR